MARRQNLRRGRMSADIGCLSADTPTPNIAGNAAPLPEHAGCSCRASCARRTTLSRLRAATAMARCTVRALPKTQPCTVWYRLISTPFWRMRLPLVSATCHGIWSVLFVATSTAASLPTGSCGGIVITAAAICSWPSRASRAACARAAMLVGCAIRRRTSRIGGFNFFSNEDVRLFEIIVRPRPRGSAQRAPRGARPSSEPARGARRERARRRTPLGTPPRR